MVLLGLQWLTSHTYRDRTGNFFCLSIPFMLLLKTFYINTCFYDAALCEGLRMSFSVSMIFSRLDPAGCTNPHTLTQLTESNLFLILYHENFNVKTSRTPEDRRLHFPGNDVLVTHVTFLFLCSQRSVF